MKPFASEKYLLPDIVREVLGYLSTPQLVQACRVSPLWYRLSFPLLHRNIEITDSPKLVWLTERLEAEAPDDSNKLRISACLRSLTLGFVTGLPPWPISGFQKVIPKLRRLRHLECCPAFNLNEILALLQVFQTECPQLTMLTFGHWIDPFMPVIGAVRADEPIPVFGNMTYLNLGWPVRSAMGGGKSVPRELIDMIEKSPDLVTLALDGRLTKALCDIKNPLKKLRHIRLRIGDEQTETACLLFLKQHPHITELELFSRGPRFWHQNQGSTTPDLVQELFPAVTRLTVAPNTGIDFVTSKIADQLQVLSLNDEWYRFEENLAYISELAAITRPLPNLRELYFYHFSCVGSDPPSTIACQTILDKLLTATPGLLVLDFSCFCFSPTGLLELLKRVPLLRRLGVQVMVHAYTFENNMDMPAVVNNLLMKMRQICPGLREIRLSLVAPSQNRYRTLREVQEHLVWQGSVIGDKGKFKTNYYLPAQLADAQAARQVAMGICGPRL